MPHTGKALRLGITGAPGVGKSTFIEAFGKIVIQSGQKVAVLAIDPTSPLTGGSILGDKTRMGELSRDAQAFIRPSPAGHTLGGVASYTRESMLLCEAAGYDMIIVETVGTGQSEIAIRNMVDFFLLLMQPGAGDELQGIKKGVVEMADAVVITKADGKSLESARATRADFARALHLAQPRASGWQPRVMLCSSVEGSGLQEIQVMLHAFYQEHLSSGWIHENRRVQLVSWFEDHFERMLSLDPGRYQPVSDKKKDLATRIREGNISPRHAAEILLGIYHDAIRKQT